MSTARTTFSVQREPELLGQTVVVIGGSAGIGLETARRMYQLIRQPRPISDRQFEIQFLDAGVEAFSFTLG
jgi:Thioredoxin like C-terminal domain